MYPPLPAVAKADLQGLLAALALCAGAALAQPQDMAPTGTLRAVINLGNPILARKDPHTGALAGVSVDLARALAERLKAFRAAQTDSTAPTVASEAGVSVADAIAFGKAYIANPDLVERLKTGAPLNTPDPSTFYGFENGPRGYTDYPTLQQVGEPA